MTSLSKIILTKKDGKVSMDKSLEYACSLLPNGVYVLNIEKQTERRTLSQNSLYWLWMGCIQDVTGTLKEASNKHFCNKFLTHEVMFNGEFETVTLSTKELNTLQMSEFMNQVQAEAATELGINLPLPCDQYYDEFVKEYKKRYL